MNVRKQNSCRYLSEVRSCRRSSVHCGERWTRKWWRSLNHQKLDVNCKRFIRDVNVIFPFFSSLSHRLKRIPRWYIRWRDSIIRGLDKIKGTFTFSFPFFIYLRHYDAWRCLYGFKSIELTKKDNKKTFSEDVHMLHDTLLIKWIYHNFSYVLKRLLCWWTYISTGTVYISIKSGKRVLMFTIISLSRAKLLMSESLNKFCYRHVLSSSSLNSCLTDGVLYILWW